MALAQRAGLADLVAEHVRPGGECGVNPHLKVGCLVAGRTPAAARPADPGGPPSVMTDWTSKAPPGLYTISDLQFADGRRLRREHRGAPQVLLRQVDGAAPRARSAGPVAEFPFRYDML